MPKTEEIGYEFQKPRTESGVLTNEAGTTASMTEVLASVDEVLENGARDAAKGVVASTERAPHVYTTATTDAARELITRHDMLASMIREDDAELMFLEEQHKLAVRNLTEQYDEARMMVEARRKDRESAAKAFAAVIAGLQEKRNG